MQLIDLWRINIRNKFNIKSNWKLFHSSLNNF